MASEPGASAVHLERALLSAYDPAEVLPLARGLHDLGVELWATAPRTLEGITAAGLPARSTEEITGLTSWFGGRVKTLHPKVHGGILAPRTPEGMAEMEAHGVRGFDLVAVTLYPFESAWTEGRPEDDLVELIDIGGVALLRAGAKNHRYVTVVSDAGQVAPLLEELRGQGGRVSAATRRRLATEAFQRTARYDGAILAWLTRGSRPPLTPFVGFTHGAESLRYGENPHQRSQGLLAVGAEGLRPWPLELLKGEALSYNNLLDLDRALSLAGEFREPTAVVVKHATPCGVASAPELAEAIARAFAGDPVAKFGCVVGVNAPFSDAAAEALKGTFVDLLVGPAFPAPVVDRLAKRPKLKLVRADPAATRGPRWEARTATGRLLLQEADQRQLLPEEFTCVSRTRATGEQLAALDFAWRVVRHARSNAIVLARGSATVGIGAGQTSRVGAVRVALEVAGDRARGSVMASDAYFPFPDGISAAGEAGVAAILQPGGSIRDAEVMAEADRFGIALYVTGWRVFRH